jgi:hypothetical protein
MEHTTLDAREATDVFHDMPLANYDIINIGRISSMTDQAGVFKATLGYVHS